MLQFEDSYDEDRRQLLDKLESLESIVRMFEIKMKNSQDHSEHFYVLFKYLNLFGIFDKNKASFFKHMGISFGIYNFVIHIHV